MPKYVLAYHGGKDGFTTPEEGKAHMEKWMAWMSGLGDAVIDPGLPVGKSMTVSASGVTEGAKDPLSGITIIAADSLDAAIEMARGCPHCNIGTIEVAEAMDMKMG